MFLALAFELISTSHQSARAACLNNGLHEHPAAPLVAALFESFEPIYCVFAKKQLDRRACHTLTESAHSSSDPKRHLRRLLKRSKAT